MTEIDRVTKEAIASMDNCYLVVGTQHQKIAIPPALRAKIVSQFLAVKGILIKADDQSLPPALYHEDEKLDPKWVEEATKNDMLKKTLGK